MVHKRLKSFYRRFKSVFPSGSRSSYGTCILLITQFHQRSDICDSSVETVNNNIAVVKTIRDGCDNTRNCKRYTVGRWLQTVCSCRPTCVLQFAERQLLRAHSVNNTFQLREQRTKRKARKETREEKKEKKKKKKKKGTHMEEEGARNQTLVFSPTRSLTSIRPWKKKNKQVNTIGWFSGPNTPSRGWPCIGYSYTAGVQYIDDKQR